jgi:hypothetical protein
MKTKRTPTSVLPPVVLTTIVKMASCVQEAKSTLWYHKSKSVFAVLRRFSTEFVW